jgi:hypothetical protein
MKHVQSTAVSRGAGIHIVDFHCKPAASADTVTASARFSMPGRLGQHGGRYDYQETDCQPIAPRPAGPGLPRTGNTLQTARGPFAGFGGKACWILLRKWRTISTTLCKPGYSAMRYTRAAVLTHHTSPNLRGHLSSVSVPAFVIAIVGVCGHAGYRKPKRRNCLFAQKYECRQPNNWAPARGLVGCVSLINCALQSAPPSGRAKQSRGGRVYWQRI